MGRPDYIEIQCKAALNRVQGMPFKWSLNPYRGCVHACHYCYARASHAYFDLDAGEDFETKIMVKVNIAQVLRQELTRPSWRGEPVALGTATDCYQPAEGRYRLTRDALGVFLAHGTPISIVTKSTMILRDRELLAALARTSVVRVFFSVTTLDKSLWRLIEPGTPPPWQRLRVMRALREAGIDAGVLMAPILPGLTDSEASISAVMAAAQDHGAAFVGASGLRLSPAVKDHYFDFIRRHFSALLPRYERAYRGAYAPQEYRERLDARIKRLRAQYRFDVDTPHPSREADVAAVACSVARQLALPL